MRLIATRSITEGTELAKAVLNDHGKVLIQRDVKLTKNMVKRLIELGVTYVYIKEKDTEDILVSPPIPEEMRIEALHSIRDSFNVLRKNDLVKSSYILEKTTQNFTSMVDNIFNEVKNREDVLSFLSDILISDDYVYTHSLNVTIYAIALATELKLPKKQIEQIGLGSMLHDIGKVFTPEEILTKPGRLTDIEFEVIKGHTVDGFNFLRKTNTIPLLVAHCAYQHHERLDGSGYPRGIKGDEIHPYGQILGISDVFDAVTSNRVYRDAMLPHQGLEILYAGSGTLFNKDYVESFRKTVALYPNGITVELSDGRTAIVVSQNPLLLERPVVRIIAEKGEKVKPYDINLANTLDIMITSCSQLTALNV
ncbi:HD-GYP domain-containing protein [Saliterribacillus persicus]|uniref:Putative nucleotidyltransferase with HDIG domain n=1 Tax=Saliterribacillus persicus TaxID=930114 RepID=A0A368XIX1_9BACI|nr:HD-GYP domain-containing protein [Saliterribacillus persicus]RCW66968.1 putative nucleotidyltransferase with HDIG domain [Saliterribacillus persicus]